MNHYNTILIILFPRMEYCTRSPGLIIIVSSEDRDLDHFLTEFYWGTDPEIVLPTKMIHFTNGFSDVWHANTDTGIDDANTDPDTDDSDGGGDEPAQVLHHSLYHHQTHKSLAGH